MFGPQFTLISDKRVYCSVCFDRNFCGPVCNRYCRVVKHLCLPENPDPVNHDHHTHPGGHRHEWGPCRKILFLLCGDFFFCLWLVSSDVTLKIDLTHAIASFSCRDTNMHLINPGTRRPSSTMPYVCCEVLTRRIWQRQCSFWPNCDRKVNSRTTGTIYSIWPSYILVSMSTQKLRSSRTSCAGWSRITLK